MKSNSALRILTIAVPVLILAIVICGGALALLGPTLGTWLLPAWYTANPTAEVDRAEADWQALGITSYAISVQEISVWAYLIHTVTVVEGAVTDYSINCVEGAALLPILTCDSVIASANDASPYTIPGLLATARDLATRDLAFTTIEFDPTYHFPTTLAFNDPNIYDEEFSQQVLDFTPYPDPSLIPTATSAPTATPAPLATVEPAP